MVLQLPIGGARFTLQDMASSSVSVGSTNKIAVKNGADASPNPYRARYASNGDAKDSQVGNGSDDVNHAMRMNWRRRLRSLISVSVGNLEPLSDSRSIVGLVGIWTPVDQAHIMVIASRPSERRQGVGELLVIATLCEAVKIGATNVTLEVRKSNDAALTLYRKYGFSEIGIRRRYYSDNHEDAVIMATPSFANLDYIRSLQRRRDGYFMAKGDTEIQVDPWQYLTLPE